MDPNSKRPNRRDNTLSLLNGSIDALNLAKDLCGVIPAKAVFGSVSVLLTMIKDSMINQRDYVELGLGCADICKALEGGVDGKRLSDLSQSVCDAIDQLKMTVAEIQKEVIKKIRRGTAPRLFHAKNDKEMIAGWKSDLNRTLHIFNTQLALNTHMMVSDLHNALPYQEGTSKHHSAQARIPLGESPPSPPRACFGRDKLIEEVVVLAEKCMPIALIGAGGIGKTSIALAVLHHDHIKKQFGSNRWFIQCDKFHPSRNHFLSQLSKTIGAGVENPKDLTPLRSFLSSRKMIIILDNVESILDPQRSSAKEIYPLVEDLTQFETVCLCITSRISTVPRYCRRPVIPTLSMDSACNIFYRIYNHGGRSKVVNRILRELDFHALSITLLATTAFHNMWDYNQLAYKWKKHRVQLLQTGYNESLAATIGLSLASPTFRELGPKAHELLSVIAFFPQGIDEKNIRWLFPTVRDRRYTFDKFCTLSLTYWSNGFITMLAPLCDHFYPKHPLSSPLLCKAKRRYFSRLSDCVDHYDPGLIEGQWIISEDVNVEHLLDVFTSIDPNSDVWSSCADFIMHLVFHKPQLVMLGPKMEGLSDYHPSKSYCLFVLSNLYVSVGDYIESKRLLIDALELYRKEGDDINAVKTLASLAEINRMLGYYKKGIQQAKEALELAKQMGDRILEIEFLQLLASFWQESHQQLNAAQEAALRALKLSLEEGDQYCISDSYYTLGAVYDAKDKIEEAITHFEMSLRTSSPHWHDLCFWNHRDLAMLFSWQGRFSDAHTHVGHAKLHAVNDKFLLGHVMKLQAYVWYDEKRFEEAKSEALCAVNVFERLGATRDLKRCRELLQYIEEGMKKPVSFHKRLASFLGRSSNF